MDARGVNSPEAQPGAEVSGQRIGVLGGTFDPIHYGHLAIAEEAGWALQLDRIYVVPTARQPLKQHEHSATPPQRMEMVRCACAGNPLLLPSEIELRRPPPSYTVDTLEELRAEIGPHAELWFILGADALADFPRWQAAERILALAHLAAVARPGATFDPARLEAALPGLSARTTLLEGPALEISSSGLRQRIAAGRPVRYQMPDRVCDYIAAQGLYRV